MAKTVTQIVSRNIELDRQVERYLAEPVPLNEITSYSIGRSADGLTTLSVQILVDAERFELKE